MLAGGVVPADVLDHRELEALTARERGVLVLLAPTNAEIPSELVVSDGTHENARRAHLRQARPARPKVDDGLCYGHGIADRSSDGKEGLSRA